MSNRNKKMVWGVVILLLVAAGAVAYWWVFMRPSPDIGGVETGTEFPIGGDTEGFGAGEIGEGEEGALSDFGAGEEGPRLRQLTTEPVAGAVIFSRGGETLVRWAERGTGHLFEIGTEESAPRRISNQTIPEIGDALWRPDGLGIIVRYAKEVAGTPSLESFYAAVGAAAKEGETLRASFLPRGVRTLAFSPTGNTLFYLSENGGGASGILSAPDGTKKSPLIELPVKDLNVAWASNDRVFLATRASASMVGRLFSVGTQSGTLEHLAEGKGLTVLPNRTGTLVLLGKSGGGVSVFDRTRAAETPLGIQTLADKCVWGRRERTKARCAVPDVLPNTFPDAWYQGAVSTSDSFWTIDGEDGRGSILALPAEALREDFDAVNLDISPDDQYLIFQNKKDLTLWLLEF